jgi:SAM-dependent methyltransferase
MLGQVLRSLHQRVLGHPFVYNHVRPLVAGGNDRSDFYSHVEDPTVVLDIGCGTGDALRYLNGFESYVGIDTDPVAIRYSQQKYGSRPGVRFECKLVDADDVRRLAPTVGILSGVLHHLDDEQAVGLLRTLAASPRLKQILTLDVVYVHRWFNDLLARLDRGRFARTEEGYLALARRASLRVADRRFLPVAPNNDRVVYYMMTLGPVPH